MKQIYVMAGGPIDQIPNVVDYSQPDLWIGVDKGISTLLSFGIKPNVIFGDFDSIHPKDLQLMKEMESTIFQYPSEKDDTDLALAMEWALNQQPACITIFGNTGGRMDHTMGGIQLLVSDKALQGNTKVFMEDRWNRMYATLHGEYTIQKADDFPYVSFFAISPQIQGITLKGFKYPLNNKDLSIGSTLCVSNELISETGTFSFNDGILLVIRSIDIGA